MKIDIIKIFTRAKKPFIFFLLFFTVSCINYKALRFGKDLYKNFADISSNYIEGKDYSIEVYDRNSKVLVLAIHGGELEYGTSLIARNIADNDFNLYIFNAWLGRKSRQLHLTASNFDDIRALALVEKSEIALSIHCQADRGKKVCIGGRNEELKRIISEHLKKNGFDTEMPCKRLPGNSEKNIVNRSKKNGVQLEITLSLLNELDKDRDKLSKFTKIIREAVFEYQKSF